MVGAVVMYLAAFCVICAAVLAFVAVSGTAVIFGEFLGWLLGGVG